MLARRLVKGSHLKNIEFVLFSFFWAVLSIALGYVFGFFKKSSQFSCPRVSGKEVLEGFGIFIATQIAAGPILMYVYGYVFGKKFVSTAFLSAAVVGWLHIGLIVSGFLGMLAIYFLLPSVKKKLLWGPTPYLLDNLLLGAVAWLMAYPIVALMGNFIAVFLLPSLPITEQVAVQNLKEVLDHPVLLYSLSFCVIFLVPFSEELLFRGLLQSWLKQKMKGWEVPVLLTSLCFAGAHYSIAQGLFNMELLPSLFVLSLFLGFLYERQGSLAAPLALHSIYNGMTIFLILIGKEG